jgi:GTP-binding protein
MQWLTENEIAFSIIFTKSDKLKLNNIQDKISSYKEIVEEIWEEMPNYFITSSTKYVGKESLLNFIETINSSIKINP